MRRTRTNRLPGVVWLLTTALILGGMSQASAQDSSDGKGDANASPPGIPVRLALGGLGIAFAALLMLALTLFVVVALVKFIV